MPVQLHPHQQKAVDKMHNGCVLYGGVGTGKSITAMAYFVSKVCGGKYGKPGTMSTPKDIYVITTAKKRDSLDWELEAARFGIFGDKSQSMEDISIKVDSWNNIKDYVGVKDAFFIFDEQRVVGYGAWSKAFIKIARDNEWILLSATPGDTWLDYIPVFIANGWYKHKTDFLDQHVIWTPRVKYPKVLRYQDVGTLVRRRNEVLVHMPYERHTTRISAYIECAYDQQKFERAVKKRWNPFTNQPMRDPAELFSVMRRVVNSDSSRLEAVRTLMEEHPKLIVFYNFDYELEMLRELGWVWTEDEGEGEERVSNGVTVAEWNGHKHEDIPKTDKWVYLVQYRAGAEGWNCIETDAICFYSQTYSYRDWHQAHGRIDRLNTPFSTLYYFNLVSSSIIDKAIRLALKRKKSFNERDLKVPEAS